MTSNGETYIDEGAIAENLPEQEILIQSVCETMVPKLVAEDIPLLFSLLTDVFPGIAYTRAEMTGLREQIRRVCAEEYLVCGEGNFSCLRSILSVILTLLSFSVIIGCLLLIQSIKLIEMLIKKVKFLICDDMNCFRVK